nr:(+)-neomenthol dehydrogenase [Ipomoea batatas]GMD26725.1 (+)-neomenthol dehydrogenase [Ipomoea batatas]
MASILSQYSSPALPKTRWWSEETVAIVTGANKGIGFALVKRLAELGLTVVLTARDNARGLEAAERLRRLGLRVWFHRLDVSDRHSIGDFASWFRCTFSALDILVNNAAVSFNEIEQNSVEHAETVIATNYYGPKLLIAALLPMFRCSSSTARILNISSRLGQFNKLQNSKLREELEDEEKLREEQIEEMVKSFLGDVKNGSWKANGWPEVWTDYAVSKLALNAYSKVLARRYRGRGLSVNCFCPGFTQTSMTGGKGKHTPEAAAEIGAKLALLPADQLPSGIFFASSTTSASTLSKL